jgi:hypothetical protein
MLWLAVVSPPPSVAPWPSSSRLSGRLAVWRCRRGLGKLLELSCLVAVWPFQEFQELQVVVGMRHWLGRVANDTKTSHGAKAARLLRALVVLVLSGRGEHVHGNNEWGPIQGPKVLCISRWLFALWSLQCTCAHVHTHKTVSNGHIKPGTVPSLNPRIESMHIIGPLASMEASRRVSHSGRGPLRDLEEDPLASLG